MFIVLNNIGQVLTWQFTSSNSFNEITQMLSDLKTQIHQHNITVFVNCCLQRSKLKEILGQDNAVKLDAFHAIQRLTRVSQNDIHYINTVYET